MTDKTGSDLIVALAARGDGVTGEGRHVPLAAPGDRLAPGGGLLPGPHRREPPCRHFPDCGGCQLQHVDDAALAEFVAGRVTGALKGQGVAFDAVEPVHLSPPESRRRVALRAAWAGKRLALGLSAGRSHRVIDLAECPVMAPALFALVAPLREFAGRWLDRRGQWQLKLALTDQGVDLLLEGYEPDGLEAHEALASFADAHGLARLTVDAGYGPETFWEPEPVTVTLSGVAVSYPPYGFLQATADGEAALSAAVREAVGGARIIADLFAGLGTFAFTLAPDRKIYAAEGELKALWALKAAAAQSQSPVIAEHRDLFRRPLNAAEASRFGAVVLDPPRAGAKEQARELAASSVPVIAYASCNPATFARDARTLVEGGYRLARLWPVGQFRWSTHVELVGRFLRD